MLQLINNRKTERKSEIGVSGNAAAFQAVVVGSSPTSRIIQCVADALFRPLA